MENNKKITKDAKERLINENIEILKLVWYLGNGLILHKQLLHLLELIQLDSHINIKKRITEMIKAQIFTKKQVLMSKSNMLVMSATAIARFTEQDTRDIASIPSSDKTLQNSIFRWERIMDLYVTACQCGYDRKQITASELITMIDDNASTLHLTQKHSLHYYNNLLDFYPDYWSEDMLDDIACIRVEKANQKKQLLKYDSVPIDPKDQKIKDDYDYLKASLSEGQRCQQFFNINSLLNTSMSIEQITETDSTLEVYLALYDNGNLSVERVSQLSAYVYLMFKRYLQYPRKVQLYVNTYCYDSTTAALLAEDAYKRAEDLYGYMQNTRQLEHLLHSGVRFPDVEENIHIVYCDAKITEHYNISPK